MNEDETILESNEGSPIVTDEVTEDTTANEVLENEIKENEVADEVAAPTFSHTEGDKYRVTGAINIVDGSGTVQGQYPIGSIHQFPADIAEVYVNEGAAEKVTE